MISPEQIMATETAATPTRHYEDLLQVSQDLTWAASRGDMPAAQAALGRRAIIMRAIEWSLAGGLKAPGSASGILTTILELDRQTVESWQRRESAITEELGHMSAGRQAGRAYRVAVGMGTPLPRFFDDHH